MESSSIQQESRFLKLPLEIRRYIYSYILPYTIKPKPIETNHITLHPTILWIRRTTNLLRVCHQLHHEGADVLYGTNTFVINVTFHSVKFHLTWLTSRGLKPKMLYDYPHIFASHNVERIRNYNVMVEHVDSYSGMIKYNCGGPMLTAGVKDRVTQFVWAADRAGGLGSLSIRLTDGNPILKDIRSVTAHRVDSEKDVATMQEVLEPLALLHASYVDISGFVLLEFASQLKEAILQEQKHPIEDVANGAPNIEPAVLWRWQMNWNA